MQPVDVTEKIFQRAPLLIVDVRNGWEYRAGHIPGAVHIPFWKIHCSKSLFDENGKAEVLLYCEHGPRAWFAGFVLRRIGVVNVNYLAGHMLRWKREKRPLSKYIA